MITRQPKINDFILQSSTWFLFPQQSLSNIRLFVLLLVLTEVNLLSSNVGASFLKVLPFSPSPAKRGGGIVL